MLEVKGQIEEILGLDASGSLQVSAKDGTNVDAVLEAVAAL